MTGIRRVSQLGTTGESTYVDGSIVDADINASAAIALTKLSGTSANLRTALGAETTGTGNAVFSTSPTLVTPVLGVAAGTSFNSITGLSSTTPIVDGTAAVGVSTTTARGDHVHPTDNLAGGLVYITSATASATAAFITLQNCFSATYDNYRVIITRCYSSSTANIGYQMMDSGSNPLTTASYSWGLSGISSVGGSSNTYSNSGVRGSILDSYAGNGSGSATFDVLKPFLADQTAWLGSSIALNSGSNGYDVKNGIIFVETASSYTGFRLIAAAGNISCTATVYGYRK